MKKLFALGLIGMSTLGLAACGGGDDKDGDTDTGYTGPFTASEATTEYDGLSKKNSNYSEDGFDWLSSIEAIEGFMDTELNEGKFYNSLMFSKNTDGNITDGTDTITGATAVDTYQYLDAGLSAAGRLAEEVTYKNFDDFDMTELTNMASADYTHGGYVSVATADFYNNADQFSDVYLNEVFLTDYIVDAENYASFSEVNYLSYTNALDPSKTVYHMKHSDGNFYYAELNEAGTELEFVMGYHTGVEIPSDTYILQNEDSMLSYALSNLHGDVRVSETAEVDTHGDFVLVDNENAVTEYSFDENDVLIPGVGIGKYGSTYGGENFDFDSNIDAIKEYIIGQTYTVQDGQNFLSSVSLNDLDTGATASDREQYAKVLLKYIERTIASVDVYTEGEAQAYAYTHEGYISEAVATYADGEMSVVIDEWFLPSHWELEDIDYIAIGETVFMLDEDGMFYQTEFSDDEDDYVFIDDKGSPVDFYLGYVRRTEGNMQEFINASKNTLTK